jgi:hypothetical protein
MPTAGVVSLAAQQLVLCHQNQTENGLTVFFTHPCKSGKEWAPSAAVEWELFSDLSFHRV